MPSQLAELPLTGGIDQHSASRKLSPASLLRAENAQILKTGRYDKAYGTSLITGTAYASGSPVSMGEPFVLAKHLDERIVAATNGLFVRSEAATKAWFLADRLPEWTITEQGIIQGPDSVVDPDVAYDTANGLACYVWLSGGSSTTAAQVVYAAIKSTVTGSILLGPTQLATGAYLPHVLSINGHFVVTWNPGGSGWINATSINVGSGPPYAWPADVSILTDAYSATFCPYDICAGPSSTFIVAYENSGAAATNISFRAFNASLVQTASKLAQSNPAANVLQCATLNVVSGNLYAAFASANGTSHSVIYGYKLDPSTLNVSAGPTLLKTEAATPDGTANLTIGDHDGTYWTLAWSQISSNCVRVQDFDSSLATHGGEKTTFRTQLLSKLVTGGWALLANSTAVAYNPGDVLRGSAYWADMHGNTTLDIARVAAVWSPRIAPEGLSRNLSTLCSVVQDSAANYHALGTRTSKLLAAAYTSAPSRWTMFDLTISSDQGARQWAELGGLTYFAGGVPSYYDGLRVAEVSFLQFPYATITSNNSGGSLTSSATYQYGIIFVQYDVQGNVHRSAPMIVSQTLGVADNRCVLTISDLNLTARQDVMLNTQGVAVELYRTKANDNVFRRLTKEVSLASGVSASSTGTMQNDKSSYTFTYTDQAADATLDNQPLMYTTGNILENVNPPSSSLVCTHRNRIFYAGTPDGKTIWASKKQLVGEAPGFSEGLQLYIDDGGPITAIGGLDDKLIVFKHNQIFFITGDGPTDDGGNSDWSDPVPLITTVGAISPYVIETPLGLVFQSEVGISLLTRSLEVQPYWGVRIEDTLATYPSVRYMVLHPTLPEIRIGLVDPDGLAGLGVELRYDYRADAWLERIYNDGSQYGAMAMTSVAWDDVVYLGFGATGHIAKEDPSTYLDQGSYVPMVLEFAPMASAGTQGLQLLRSLMLSGDRYTDHDLTVDFAYGDGAYGSSPPNAESRPIPSATSAAWPAYQFQLTPTQSDWSQRIRVRLTDTHTTGTLGTGQGYGVSSVLFQLEPTNAPFIHLGETQRL